MRAFALTCLVVGTGYILYYAYVVLRSYFFMHELAVMMTESARIWQRERRAA